MKRHISIPNNRFIFIIFQFILISILCSCARRKTQYSVEGNKWKNEKPNTNLILNHTMYLVGDAGNSEKPDTVPVLKYLKRRLSTDTENSSILFLGDNIYPHGMPAKGNRKRVAAEYSISTQLDALNQFKGYPLFVPGNHDWKLDKDFLKEQREFVQHYLDSTRNAKTKDYFLPSKGDIGPVPIELNDNIVLVIIDSHQLIKRWKQESNGRSNGERFKAELDSVLTSHKSKNIVLAMHHPLYTYGPHGGYLSFWQHIFPATEFHPIIVIPLPLVGWLFRRFIGIPQDIHSHKYNRFRKAIFTSIQNKGNLTFVTGHEHTLQYVERDNQNLVISGSGSKTSPVGMGKGSLFSSVTIGFSTLSFYEGGETWVTYYHVSKDGRSAEIAFQKKIKDKS